MQYLAMVIVFPRFSSLFDICIIFMNMQMRLSSHRASASINLSYDITGSTTKCQNDGLGLKLVHLKILNDFLPFFIVSLKLMNMQIRSFALLTIKRKDYI